MFDQKIQKAVESAKDDIKAEIKNEIKNEIKELCQGMVGELFGDMRDEYEDYRYWFPFTVKTLGGQLRERMISAAREEFDELYAKRANDLIAGEEFIDSVVERIHKKQLTSK